MTMPRSRRLPLLLPYLLTATFLPGAVVSLQPLRSWKRQALNLLAQQIDFTKKGWEHYYRTECEEEVIEWHESIPLEVIAQYCETAKRVLVVGCGNSRLPDHFLHKELVVLLDSSPTCVDQLKVRYGGHSNVHVICGDALKLSDYFADWPCFDIVIDKSLLDTFLTLPNGSASIATLLRESRSVLHDDGRYLLICYRLSATAWSFVSEVLHEAGFSWENNLPHSNDQTSIHMGCKTDCRCSSVSVGAGE